MRAAVRSVMRILVASIAAVVGCGPAAEPAADVEVAVAVAAAPDHPVVADHSERERVRAVLAGACGLCHIGASSQQPAALGVFDLEEADFAARMTDDMLQAMPERLDSMALDPADAAAVLAYVSVVFAERRAAEPAPQDC